MIEPKRRGDGDLLIGVTGMMGVYLGSRTGWFVEIIVKVWLTRLPRKRKRKKRITNRGVVEVRKVKERERQVEIRTKNPLGEKEIAQYRGEQAMHKCLFSLHHENGKIKIFHHPGQPMKQS